MGLIDLVKAAARHAGIPVVRVEDDFGWQMRQKPVETRMVPKPMSFGEMPVSFYPHLFRWHLDDGRHFAMVMHPIIKARGPWFEEDGRAMAEKLLDAVKVSAPSPSTP